MISAEPKNPLSSELILRIFNRQFIIKNEIYNYMFIDYEITSRYISVKKVRGVKMDIGKIGFFIRKLRTEKNITQKQLGERLNISYQAVSKWERGETLPDTMILTDLAAVLEISVDTPSEGRQTCHQLQ